VANRDLRSLTALATFSLPVQLNILTDWLAPEFRWAAYASGSVFAASVLFAWPGGFLSRERHGRSRLGKYISGLIFLAYCTVGAWIGIGDGSTRMAYVSLFLLWAAVTVLVLNSVEEDSRLPQVAAGMAAFLIGAAYLMEIVPQIRGDEEGDPKLAGTLASLFIALAFFMLAGALIKQYLVLIGIGLLANGISDLVTQAWAFSAGLGVIGVARLLKGVAFILVGYAWLAWSKRAGVGGLFLFGSGWAIEGIFQIAHGRHIGGAGSGVLAFALCILAAMVWRPRRFDGGGTRQRWLRIAALFIGTSSVLWGIERFHDGAALLGSSYVLLGIAIWISSIALDLEKMSRENVLRFWLGTRGESAGS
jgi:MFS family permease